MAGVGPTERNADMAAGLIAKPISFAANRISLVVPPSNPAHIRSLEDLAKPHRLVLGAAAVPIGAYSRELLRRASTLYGDAFGDTVLAHLVSEESSVSGVLLKVQLGEADVGLVYRTDVLAAKRAGRPVREIPLPEAVVPTTEAWIAPIAGGREGTLAQEWIAFLGSAEGKAILHDVGFE